MHAQPHPHEDACASPHTPSNSQSDSYHHQQQPGPLQHFPATYPQYHGHHAAATPLPFYGPTYVHPYYPPMMYAMPHQYFQVPPSFPPFLYHNPVAIASNGNEANPSSNLPSLWTPPTSRHGAMAVMTPSNDAYHNNLLHEMTTDINNGNANLYPDLPSMGPNSNSTHLGKLVMDNDILITAPNNASYTGHPYPCSAYTGPSPGILLGGTPGPTAYTHTRRDSVELVSVP